jgi:hypothetical protein
MVPVNTVTAVQPLTMAAPVMRAWFSVSSSEEHVAAINRHYHVAPENSLPPTRLLAEWREAGHPDPGFWIQEKVTEILEDQAA